VEDALTPEQVSRKLSEAHKRARILQVRKALVNVPFDGKLLYWSAEFTDDNQVSAFFIFRSVEEDATKTDLMVSFLLPMNGNERLPLTDTYVAFRTEGVIKEVTAADVVHLKDVRLTRINPSNTPSRSPPPLTTDNLKIPVFTADNDEVSFSFGDHGITVTVPMSSLTGSSPFRWSPVRMPGQDLPIFYLYIADGMLYADVHLMRGAIIERAHLRNMPDGWDANMAEGAIEVVDERSQPMYQMEYVSKGHIVFRGVFPSGSDKAWVAGENFAMGPVNELKPLKRMFKYPSKDFKGDREATK
jgi:hypothetical protein